jgi:hypothetical protein
MVPYAVVALRPCLTYLLGSPSFRRSMYIIILAWSLMIVSLVHCRNSTVGHPSAGSSQLLLGPTIALGLFLRLLAVPYS